MIDYPSIFRHAEKTLRSHSNLTDEEFEKRIGYYKTFEKKTRTDNEIYQLLVMIIFYSGFRASTVERKAKTILGYFSDYSKVSNYSEQDFHRILSNPDMIKNNKKIRACITNARTFKNIINKSGSFTNYLEGFKAKDSFENLILLKEELEYTFEFLGGITVYHFLTDLGYYVLKPDRVILRLLLRLGLIESEGQLLKAVIQGRKFAEATDLPIRYIDVIFVLFGQQGGSVELGLEDGICLTKNPRCHICQLKENCHYYTQNH